MDNASSISVSFATPLRVIHVMPAPEGRQYLAVTFESFTITVEGDYVMYTLPVGKQVQMQVSYVDAAGNPAAVDGEVTWGSSNVGIATATVDPADSTIVTVVPVGPLGQVQITATADADLGSGIRNLITVADIEIVAGEAIAGTISPVGEPVDIPA